VSVALDYANETIRKLLPEDRLKLLHSLPKYCWECGRVGLQSPSSPSRSCFHCGRSWRRADWSLAMDVPPGASGTLNRKESG